MHTERYGPVIAGDYTPIRRRLSSAESAPASRLECFDATAWRTVEFVCNIDPGVVASITVGRWLQVTGNGVALNQFVPEYTVAGLTGAQVLRTIGDGHVMAYVSAATGMTGSLGVSFVARGTNLDLGFVE